MGPPAFYTKVLNYMKVGQHYYSTLYKGQEPLEYVRYGNERDSGPEEANNLCWARI